GPDLGAEGAADLGGVAAVTGAHLGQQHVEVARVQLAGDDPLLLAEQVPAAARRLEALADGLLQELRLDAHLGGHPLELLPGDPRGVAEASLGRTLLELGRALDDLADLLLAEDATVAAHARILARPLTCRGGASSARRPCLPSPRRRPRRGSRRCRGTGRRPGPSAGGRTRRSWARACRRRRRGWSR